jgi:hypothetical protein
MAQVVLGKTDNDWFVLFNTKYVRRNKMKKVLAKGLALAFVGSLVMAGSAMALSISLTDGTTIVNVTDADNDGYVDYDGVVGNWKLSSTVGSSAPLVGTESKPVLAMVSFNVDKSTDGMANETLKISVFDTYTGPLSENIASFVSIIDGNSIGLAIDYTLKITDTLNSTYTSSILWDDFAHAGMDFDGLIRWSDLSAYDFSGGYSIEMINSISGQGFASFDATTTAPVPEPATMLLFGSGLAGLAGYGRRKVRKK